MWVSHLPQGAYLQRAALPTAMSWHPTKKILAVGWANGELSIWNDSTHTAFDCKAMHTAAITFVKWKDDGLRVASGDREGKVGVWKAIPKTGRLNLTTELQVPGELNIW